MNVAQLGPIALEQNKQEVSASVTQEISLPVPEIDSPPASSEKQEPVKFSHQYLFFEQVSEMDGKRKEKSKHTADG